MRPRKRGARDKRTYDVRDALQARVGLYEDLATATDEQRATTLVVECGDLLLELLVTTATESLDRASRQQRRRDEAALTEALRDANRVERAWVILARGLVDRTLMATRAAGVDDDVAAHERAASLLAEQFPLSEDDEEYVRTAPKAEALGFYCVELVLTAGAFAALLDNAADDLALLSTFEPYVDISLLRASFEHASAQYLQLISSGVVAPRSQPGHNS